LCSQRFNKSDYRKAVEADAGSSFNKKVLQCIVAIGAANVLIFARSRTLDPQSLEDLATVIATEREILFEVLGVGDTPNAHTGKHFPMFAHLHTLLRLIWTNRGEAKHLQFKLMVKAMNKWNIEADMLLFDDLHQVLSSSSSCTSHCTPPCTSRCTWSSLLMHYLLHPRHSVTALEATECKRRGQ
jgi:hypothetical protein